MYNHIYYKPVMFKNTFTVLSVLFFVGCNANFLLAQERENKLDSFFSAIDKNGDISGSVLVAEKGKVLYQKSFGYADIQSNIPNTENTLFQIASVSKLFTAIAVLQLDEQKKLNITDRFAKYVPHFPYPEVTIKQILSNTSGIPDDGEVFRPFFRLNHDTSLSLHDVIPALIIDKLPLNFNAGEHWEYSNTNYNLLALLVEKVSGETFGNYLSKNIFKPAGMKNTFQKASGTNPYTRPNVAYNYALPFRFSSVPVRVDSFAVNDFIFHYRTVPSEGDANIYTSITDIANFDKALHSGLLLKRNTPYTPSTRNNGKKVELHGVGSEIGEVGDFYWGYGNRISLDSSLGEIVWESGGMPGCTANVISNLTKHQLIIWLNNKESASAMNNMFGALDILNNRPATVKKGKEQVAQIYGRQLLQYGEDYAFGRLMENKSDTINYIFDVNEFNELGYEFSEKNMDTLALTTFRTAILLSPDDDNLFNSYGEVLAKSGKQKEAIMMYKKSLLLNPKNEDSKTALQKLQKNEQ